jgi:hypothetical protein
VAYLHLRLSLKPAVTANRRQNSAGDQKPRLSGYCRPMLAWRAIPAFTDADAAAQVPGRRDYG